jgi:hypothetical protein
MTDMTKNKILRLRDGTRNPGGIPCFAEFHGANLKLVTWNLEL